MTRQQLIDRQQKYITRIRQGQRQLIPELWELMRPLTARYIQRYIIHNKTERLYDADDLWQESYIALLYVLDYWRPDKGAFSATYLWALQNATRAIRGTASRDAIFAAESLNKPLDDESDAELSELIEDETASDSFADVEQTEYIRELQKTFAGIDREQQTPEQMEVIRGLYYDGLTVKQTAARMGVSESECRAAQARALNVYRKPRNRQLLHPYLNAYSCVGFAAYKLRQASVVEYEVERMERLRTLSDKVNTSRRQRWEREAEYINACKGDVEMSTTLREAWQRYIEGETESSPAIRYYS